MGGAVVDALLSSGAEVRALVRTDQGAQRLAARGAQPVRGDLRDPSSWAASLSGCDLVIHAGLPRIVPPVRRRHLARLERQASEAAAVLAKVCDGGDIVMVSCGLADARGPLDVARPARGAERALQGPGLRVVRVPWVYGPSGFIADIARGLAMNRFRIVGGGGNHIALIGVSDAAAAAIGAVSAPPGTYSVGEEDLPTQMELVHHLCAARGANRPDHVPPGLASLSMGGVVVRALTADNVTTGVPPPGFALAQSWRRDLAESISPSAPPPSED